MIYLIDSNSLSRYAQYYLPFADDVVISRINQTISNNEWIITDRVYNELRNMRQGSFHSILLDNFPEDHLPVEKTGDIIFGKIGSFLKRLNDEFCNSDLKKLLTKAEFETEKKKWLASADAQLIFYAFRAQENDEEITIITEETEYQNDGKVVNKIPYICKRTNIKCIDLVRYLSEYSILKIQ